MRIQQVGFRKKPKTIKAKQTLEAYNVISKYKDAKKSDQVSYTQVENYQPFTYILNEAIQKKLEILNWIKNYRSFILNLKEFQQKVTLDNSSVQDIILLKPVKQSMKRSMKRFLKKKTMQKMIKQSWFNINQLIMDLLLFQKNLIETKPSHQALMDVLLVQAENIFLKRETVKQGQMVRQKQKQEMMINVKKTFEQLSKPQSSFSAKKLSKAAEFTPAENQSMLCKSSSLNLNNQGEKQGNNEWGGCGISKMNIAYPQNLKQDEQQKLKSDKFFDENKYADESQFGDFIEMYNKYYTNNEINHEVLENRIRTVVEALHKQCEHIFSITIRPKVIELINLLINYYMIAIQKNDIQTIQKFIDKTDAELKDLKETCFQNRKKYPCLDLCQYFELLICLNQQRQGIDKVNQNQALKIAEIILKVVKFGAGFTSIFGAIDTLSKIQLEDIQKQFKEIKQVCAKLFESSQGVGKQALEQYTSYSSGNLSNRIQAIWLRKVQSLGDDLRDEHQQTIFYLKEINEVQNNGNNEIVLFVYMQLNYLLQKKQKDDNLNTFSKLLKDTNQENLIFDLINYLQFKTYSTTLFENAKKLLDAMNIEKYTEEIVNESKESYQTMKQMIQNEEQLNKIANKIESKNDVAILLARTYVQMWEASVKQRQEQNKIAHKDDALLEVIQLYIKQKVTYLEGNSFFLKCNNKSEDCSSSQSLNNKEAGNSQEDLDNKDEDDQIQLNDALNLIINKFLIPNFVQPKDKQDQKIAQLLQQISQLEQQNQKFKANQAQLQMDFEPKNKEKQQQETKIQQTNQENISLKQKIEKLENNQQKLENELKAQQNLNAQQEKIISQLKQLNTQLEQQNKQLKESQKKIEKDLQGQVNQNNIQKEQIGESVQTNQQLNLKISSSKQTLSKLESELKSYKDQKQNVSSQNYSQPINYFQENIKKEGQNFKLDQQKNQKNQLQEVQSKKNTESTLNLKYFTNKLASEIIIGKSRNYSRKMGQNCSIDQTVVSNLNQPAMQHQLGSSYAQESVPQLGEKELEIIQQKLVPHIQNRQKIREMYKLKGIQLLDKPELIRFTLRNPLKSQTELRTKGQILFNQQYKFLLNNSKIKNLKQTKQQLQMDFEHKNKEKQQQETKLQQTNQENISLKQKIEKLENNQQKLENELKAQQNVNAQQEKKISQLNQLNTQLEQQNKQLRESQKKIEKDLQEQVNQNNIQKKQIGESEQTNQQLNLEISSLKQTLSKLESELKAYKDQKQNVSSQNYSQPINYFQENIKKEGQNFKLDQQKNQKNQLQEVQSKKGKYNQNCQ
ncbi:hypothetical protein ABPG72_020909 [Tetrahymena utriculariae]